MKNKIWNYNEIVSNKSLFYEIVYTPLSEAIKILEERQKDKKLIKKIEELLNNDIPEPLRKIDKYGICGKQIATPNSDIVWFIKLTKEFKLKTLFLEYPNDKFTSNNEFKHSLGKLIICKKLNKNGKYLNEKINIIDFNKNDGKPLKDIYTKNGELLTDFHKRLFKPCGFDIKDFIFFDQSEWLKRNGGNAKNYYKKDLLLYICHGILFENFLIEDGDNFVLDILLPAFEKVFKETGLRPLIVPIPPMEIENDSYWVFYDKKIKSLLM
jgi:hypothetical protein